MVKVHRVTEEEWETWAGVTTTTTTTTTTESPGAVLCPPPDNTAEVRLRMAVAQLGLSETPTGGPCAAYEGPNCFLWNAPSKLKMNNVLIN